MRYDKPRPKGWGFLFDEKFGTGVPVIILSGKGCMTLIGVGGNPDKIPDGRQEGCMTLITVMGKPDKIPDGRQGCFF